MNETQHLRMMVYASLLAALTAAGAFISIPLGPVPIVLQNLFIFLAGLLLGGNWGAASVGVYLLAGACGLPVFAGGSGGVGRFLGPTGGYLLGFLPAAYIVGIISGGGPQAEAGAGEGRSFRRQAVLDVLGMLAGTAVIYGLGVSWLKTVTGMTWGKSAAVGMVPFLIGDAVKIAAAVPIARALRPIVKREM